MTRAAGRPALESELARYALDLDFASLPLEIVAWAKDVLLDTVGCALAGYFSEPSQISRAVFVGLGGAPESTVIGSGEHLPCPSAAFVNGVMVRYEDLNDIYVRKEVIGHYSDIIPTVLAVGERAQATGADVLTAIVLGYEAQAASTFHGEIVGKGVVPLGAVATPVVAGKLLGLNEDQIINAIGLSLSCNIVLLSWYGSAKGEMPMIKASAFASTAHHGILATLMAAEGYTGPTTAIDTYLDHFRLDRSAFTVPATNEFSVLDYNMIKAYAAQAHTNAAVEGTIRLAKTHGINGDDVEAITLYGSEEMIRLTAGPSTYKPTTREFADHSAPYVVAISLIEGDLLPAQYGSQQWKDAHVLDLMQKVKCVVDEDCERLARERGAMPARLEIRTHKEVYAISVDNPRGHPDNPMTSGEIEDKFRRVVNLHLDRRKQDEIIGVVSRLDKEPSLVALTDALMF
jgi:2-methylcitrate dehydratase